MQGPELPGPTQAPTPPTGAPLATSQLAPSPVSQRLPPAAPIPGLPALPPPEPGPGPPPGRAPRPTRSVRSGQCVGTAQAHGKEQQGLPTVTVRAAGAPGCPRRRALPRETRPEGDRPEAGSPAGLPAGWVGRGRPGDTGVNHTPREKPQQFRDGGQAVRPGSPEPINQGLQDEAGGARPRPPGACRAVNLQKWLLWSSGFYGVINVPPDT